MSCDDHLSCNSGVSKYHAVREEKNIINYYQFKDNKWLFVDWKGRENLLTCMNCEKTYFFIMGCKGCRPLIKAMEEGF